MLSAHYCTVVKSKSDFLYNFVFSLTEAPEAEKTRLQELRNLGDKSQKNQSLGARKTRH
jgi:hypothetical protein